MSEQKPIDLTQVELDFPPPHRKNELDPRLLGSAVGLNPFVSSVSPSRLQMFTSHLGQMVIVSGSTVRQHFAGCEREYGKYVFNRKIKHESRVIEHLPRFRNGITEYSVGYNPSTTLVLATTDDDGSVIYDLLELGDHHILHQSYGYQFKNTEAYRKITDDIVFPENTILKQSPAVTEHGDWKFGRETNVAFMSVPAIIEDGIRASESVCKELSFTAIKKAVAQCGGKFVPLNLYGDDTHYKPFPDVGEKIADHGMIMALRRFDPMMAPVNMTPKALREIDYAFDRPIRGKAGAIIADVDVWFGGQHRNGADRLPVGMETQFAKYSEQHRQYFERLVSCYNRLKRMSGNMEPPLSPRFQRKLVEAYARLGRVPGGHKLQFTYKQTPVDDWRVEFTYRYTVVPTIGFKISDTMGGKGVIVEIQKDEDMPTDGWGRRAELVLDGDSTIKRMNIGRLYEHWTNALAWDVRRKVISMLDHGNVEGAWKYLCNFYKAGYPEHWDMMTRYLDRERARGKYDEAVAYHLESIRKGDIVRFLPPNSSVAGAEQIRRLKSVGFRAPKSPVTYGSYRGGKVSTRRDVMIGSMYIIVLEKTGDDWSSVSSPRLQHYGIPAKLSRADKQSTPGHESPVRFLGEDEVRLVAAAAGGDVVSELLDMTNAPQVHKHVVRNILIADEPTNIPAVRDHAIAPRNNNRALGFVKHLIQCGGTRFVFPEDEK